MPPNLAVQVRTLPSCRQCGAAGAVLHAVQNRPGQQGRAAADAVLLHPRDDSVIITVLPQCSAATHLLSAWQTIWESIHCSSSSSTRLRMHLQTNVCTCVCVRVRRCERALPL